MVYGPLCEPPSDCAQQGLVGCKATPPFLLRAYPMTEPIVKRIPSPETNYFTCGKRVGEPVNVKLYKNDRGR